MRCLLLWTLLSLAAATGGCASSPPAVSDGRQHAECTVCKYNADLACIDVAVDKETPHCEYEGKTYYFCSQECLRKFQKEPQKYARE